MADAEKYTEEKLAAMEAHIRKIYTDADEGIRKAWDEYMRKASANVADLQKAYDAAKASGDKDAIRKAGKELGIAQRQQTVDSRYYQNMVNATTYQLANVNQTALAYVNGQLPNIYSTNYNAIATESPIKGYAYDLVDASTVKHLATTDDSLLPTKSLNVPKDQAWNTKSINSQVLQGILQGESIDKIAGRLENVVGMNTKSAIRNARTMTTSAQNKGRQDSYDKAVSDGVVMQKVWIATPDERVRAWHMALHHVAVDVDKSWSNEYGDIEYPGDPHASPGNVYNCRCTMKTKIIGFRGKDGTIYNVDGTTTEPEVKSSSLSSALIKDQRIARIWKDAYDRADIEHGDYDEYVWGTNIIRLRSDTPQRTINHEVGHYIDRTGSWTMWEHREANRIRPARDYYTEVDSISGYLYTVRLHAAWYDEEREAVLDWCKNGAGVGDDPLIGFTTIQRNLSKNVSKDDLDCFSDIISAMTDADATGGILSGHTKEYWQMYDGMFGGVPVREAEMLTEYAALRNSESSELLGILKELAPTHSMYLDRAYSVMTGDEQYLRL